MVEARRVGRMKKDTCGSYGNVADSVCFELRFFLFLSHCRSVLGVAKL